MTTVLANLENLLEIVLDRRWFDLAAHGTARTRTALPSVTRPSTSDSSGFRGTTSTFVRSGQWRSLQVEGDKCCLDPFRHRNHAFWSLSIVKRFDPCYYFNTFLKNSNGKHDSKVPTYSSFPGTKILYYRVSSRLNPQTFLCQSLQSLVFNSN